jgi:UDP-glucose 4-epimerase
MAAELLAKDIDFVIVDNLSNSDKRNLDTLHCHFKKEIRFVQCDIRERVPLQKVFKDHRVTSVIHFASLKSVGESVRKPKLYKENNEQGARELIYIAKKCGVQQFIFSSSACVYGEPLTLPIDETHRIRPTNPYGQNKVAIETMLREDPYFTSHCRTTILRYFNPIGAFTNGLIGEIPRGVPNNLMPYILGVANKEYPHLRIFGDDYATPDGTAVRDYIHIMDLVDAHLKALQDGAQGLTTFNVGTGQGYSVREIIDTFERVNQIEVPFQVVARREGDVASCYADNKKITQELGWKSRRDLSQMCRDAYLFASLTRG